MFAKSRDLKIVFDVAEASKHRFLTRKPERRDVKGSTEGFMAEKGRLFMPDIQEHYDSVLDRAVDFWKAWLNL